MLFCVIVTPVGNCTIIDFNGYMRIVYLFFYTKNETLNPSSKDYKLLWINKRSN